MSPAALQRIVLSLLLLAPLFGDDAGAVGRAPGAVQVASLLQNEPGVMPLLGLEPGEIVPPISQPPAAQPPAAAPPAAAPPVAPHGAALEPGLPAWRRFAVPAPPAEGRPILVFILDDMGLNRPQSDRAVALPGPLTLSWMAYAPDIAAQAARGTAHGHETMLHMPMEPLGRTNPGPNALRIWLPPATNLANLRTALDRIPGAVALNQHEGSVASLSVPLMDLVMGELHERGMAFVDSVTIAHSVAERRALADDVPAVARDVFLDNSPDPAAIRAQLAQAEGVARRYGMAIAIGHPRQTTMDVMEGYLPKLAARGFVLWPVSAAVMARNPVVMSGAK